jgi:hypothetical protein
LGSGPVIHFSLSTTGPRRGQPRYTWREV